jgi:toxin ParE1/3/4
VPGSLARDEVAPGLRSLHAARRGRRGRHVVLDRVAGGNTIEVVRILHDAMDLPRHLPRPEA